MADVPIFSAINSLIKACELAYKLAEVTEESDVFVRSIFRVRDDLQETERLLQCHQIKTKLEDLPEKKKWIKQVILDTKKALNHIGQYIERARADKERDGTVSFATRWQWVMGDHDKLNNRREELGTCHRSLGLVLNFLIPLESQSTPSSKGEDVPPAYSSIMEDDISFENPYMLRKLRQKNQGEDGSSKPAESASPLQVSSSPRKDTPITEEKTLFTSTSWTQEKSSVSQESLGKPEVIPFMPQTTSAGVSNHTEAHLKTPPIGIMTPNFQITPSNPYPNTYHITATPGTGMSGNPLPSNATAHIYNSSTVPVTEIPPASGIAQSTEECHNFRTNIGTTPQRPLSSANTLGPVDPFALYSELPGTSVVQKNTSYRHASDVAELQSSPVLSLESLSVSDRLSPNHIHHELPTFPSSSQPQLPPANGYAIHELPSKEHIAPMPERPPISRMARTTYPPQAHSSIAISSWSSSTHQMHEYVAEMPSQTPTHISAPMRASQQDFPTTAAELPSPETPFQQSTLTANYAHSLPSHANTYPPPTQYPQVPSSMSQQSLPYTNAPNTLDKSQYTYTTPTTAPIQSPPTTHTPSPAVSPVSFATPPAQPINPSTVLSPEAAVGQRRRRLMYAITGE